MFWAQSPETTNKLFTVILCILDSFFPPIFPFSFAFGFENIFACWEWVSCDFIIYMWFLNKNKNTSIDHQILWHKLSANRFSQMRCSELSKIAQVMRQNWPLTPNKYKAYFTVISVNVTCSHYFLFFLSWYQALSRWLQLIVPYGILSPCVGRTETCF